MSLDHLRLADLSDRELLLLVADHADGEGWASAKDIALQLQMSDGGHRSVANRLSWLMRHGVVERELLWDEHGNAVMHTRNGQPAQKRGQRWRLTETGQAMAAGKLRAAQLRALAELTDGQLLVAARELAARTATASDGVQWVGRREWQRRWEH